jgi:hypothetical protein
VHVNDQQVSKTAKIKILFKVLDFMNNGSNILSSSANMGLSEVIFDHVHYIFIWMANIKKNLGKE